MKISNSDGGTLYLKDNTDSPHLMFECLINKSLNTYITRQSAANKFPPLYLYDKDGKQNHQTVACHVALEKNIVNIPLTLMPWGIVCH